MLTTMGDTINILATEVSPLLIYLRAVQQRLRAVEQSSMV